MSEQDNNNGAIDVEKLTPEQIAAIDASDEFIVNFKEEDYDDPDKVEELRKHVENSKTTIHQKRHFRDKATKLEADLVEAGKAGKAGKPPVKKDDKPGNDGKADDGAAKVVDPTQIVNFRLDNPSYSKEVITEITRLAGAFGVSMEEVAASETGKAVIKSIESRNDNADATLPPSRKAGTGIEKRDWSNATPAEIEAQRNLILTGQ